GRAGTAHPDRLAHEILDRADRLRVLRRDDEHVPGKIALNDDRPHVLVLALATDRVLVVAGRPLDRAAEHRRQPGGAGLEPDQLRVDSVLLVMPELLCEDARQIADAPHAGDAELQPHFLLRRRGVRRCERQDAQHHAKELTPHVASSRYALTKRAAAAITAPRSAACASR